MKASQSNEELNHLPRSWFPTPYKLADALEFSNPIRREQKYCIPIPTMALDNGHRKVESNYREMYF